jgi:hypothetical protein
MVHRSNNWIGDWCYNDSFDGPDSNGALFGKAVAE